MTLALLPQLAELRARRAGPTSKDAWSDEEWRFQGLRLLRRTSDPTSVNSVSRDALGREYCNPHHEAVD
jgi:hypothetical protein